MHVFLDENDTRILLDKNHNAHFKQVFSYAYFMRVLLDKNYIRVCGFRLLCIMITLITNNYSIPLGLLVSFGKKKLE